MDFGISQTIAGAHDYRVRHQENRREDRFRLQDYNRFLEDRDYQSKYFDRLMADAKQHGLHPLSVLGHNVVGGPSFNPTSYKGSGSNAAMGGPVADFRKLNEVDKANIRHLDAQTEFVNEQAAASRMARGAQALAVTKPIQDARGNIVQDPEAINRYTLPLGMGTIRRDPANLRSSAQTLEDSSGEAASFVLGALGLLDDVTYELGQRNDESVKPFIKSLFRRGTWPRNRRASGRSRSRTYR